ncbi:MAG TPA: hypothetical protein VGR34_06505 [Candidatus Dormibacteraeota bacterium]|nr:hypothetical protein [Candidatus Dormibacteraeota bacterium]
MKITILLFASFLACTGAMAQKICRKHPDWTAEECANVQAEKIFVGMTREMVDAEKPMSCVLDRHPTHREPGLVQFGCFTQWDHSVPDRAVPYIIHFQFTDGRVSAFSYN